MARRGDREFAVRTQGLSKLQRSLGKIDKDLRRDSIRHLREVAKRVRGTGQGFAPVRTGALKGSFRYQAGNRGASVSSALPYAAVHEYGGTIAPRGVPIEIKRSRMLGRAVGEHAGDIEEQLGDLLDAIARRNGFGRP